MQATALIEPLTQAHVRPGYARLSAGLCAGIALSFGTLSVVAEMIALRSSTATAASASS